MWRRQEEEKEEEQEDGTRSLWRVYDRRKARRADFVDDDDKREQKLCTDECSSGNSTFEKISP